jgi:heat-inducible transcriptional repressor
METGHLRQPHTSSGRVPSNRGYRYFVDYLMDEEALDPELRASLEHAFDDFPPDMEAILEGTAMTVARAADNVGVVTSPRTSESRLKYLDLIHLETRRVLAVVVLEGNLVRQQPIELPTEVDQEALGRLSRRIKDDLKGRSAAEIGSYVKGRKLVSWERAAIEGIAAYMAAHDAQSATVVVHDGVRNLVKQPEFVDAERLLPVLEVLEQSRDLARVLESLDPGDEVEVVIGEENPDMHLHQCSLVMTTYHGGGITGTLGTIGPTRMRYSEVVARLRYISELAGRSIARLQG